MGAQQSMLPAESRTEARSKDKAIKATKPDLEELRRLRTAYFDASRDVRRRASVAVDSPLQAREATSALETAANEAKDHGRRYKSSSKADRRKSYSLQRTEEYVYGASSSRPHNRERGAGGVNVDERRRSSESTAVSSQVSPSAHDDDDDDVLPSDSVSQSGRHRSVRHSRTSKSRPPMNRRRTAPTALESDSPTAAKPVRTPTAASHKSSTRPAPSLFGSLMRRKTTTSVPSATRTVECLTCGADDIPVTRSAKLECGHRLCDECLRRLFALSVKDPAHMPPKCCTNHAIPLKHVSKLFDDKFKVLWNRKYDEYCTKNKVYCPMPRCGKWIRPANFRTAQGRRYALCPRCSTRVCTLCGAKMHKAQECPKDPEIARLVQQAKEQGWQSCYSCRAIVERKEGCNHMTCRCRAEFCIVCGSRWKTCECPWFNYAGGAAAADEAAADQLREMRPVQVRIIPVLLRQQADIAAAVTGDGPRPAGDQGRAGAPRAPAAAAAATAAAAARAERNGPRRARTYADELAQRRQQERQDADLARRMQLATFLGSDDSDDEEARAGNARARAAGGVRADEVETWGVGNAAGHFMNDDFVQNAANVVMGAFGDAAFGRRGERAAGRRRRPNSGIAGQHGDDAGLVPDFLGDESVLNRTGGQMHPTD